MAIARDPQGGAKVLAYVGATAGVSDADCVDVYTQAVSLVAGFCSDANGVEITPDEEDAAVIAGAVLEVASKLWLRRKAPNGQAAYDLDGNAVQLAPRDPLVTAYPALSRVMAKHSLVGLA